MNKTLRQRAVLDVLKHGSIASQEDLQRLLRKRGFKVGQATLSRDIRDLNLSKTSHGYSLPQGESGAGVAPWSTHTVRSLGVRRGGGAF